jgi:hypothetical protein
MRALCDGSGKSIYSTNFLTSFIKSALTLLITIQLIMLEHRIGILLLECLQNIIRNKTNICDHPTILF